MTEKNQQEKMAAERQVELFTKAFGKAKEDKRKEYRSSGTTGTSMSTSTTLRTKSAVQTTRLSLQTSKLTTKESEAVKSEPCSILSRLPYPWLTRPPLKLQSRNMAG